MLPALLASPVFQQAAIAGGGYLANRLLNGEPKQPDQRGIMDGQYMRGMRRLNRTASRQRERSEASNAARGVSGSGGIAMAERQAQATMDAASNLEGQRADALAQAANREEMLRYEDERARNAARLNAVGGLAQTAAFSAAMRGMGGGAPAAPAMPSRGASVMAAGLPDPSDPMLNPMPRAAFGDDPYALNPQTAQIIRNGVFSRYL